MFQFIFMILVSQTECTSHLIPFVGKINTQRKMAVCLPYFLVYVVNRILISYLRGKGSLSAWLTCKRFWGVARPNKHWVTSPSFILVEIPTDMRHLSVLLKYSKIPRNWWITLSKSLFDLQAGSLYICLSEHREVVQVENSPPFPGDGTGGQLI